MTAHDSKLVERVADAIDMASDEVQGFPRHDRNLVYAQAAIDACRAEELLTALRDLLDDSQHRDHGCGDTPENCPVLAARDLLAQLDGVPPEQPA